MNILVIDDDKPEDLFPSGHIRAKTLNHGTYLLMGSGVVWDEVWLDHDLGVVDGRTVDIMPLVRFLEEQDRAQDRQFGVKKFIIHTMNPVGQKNIVSALQNTSYPYSVWSW